MRGARGQQSGSQGRVRRALTAAVSAAVTLVASAGLLVVLAGPAAAETLPAGFSTTDEPTGQNGVVEIAHAPDGRRFLAEKRGYVRVLHPDGRLTTLLDMRNHVNSASDRGLLGMAVDKDFASNGWLYLLFSQELRPSSPDGDGPMTSALTRVTVRPDNTVVEPLPGVYILGAQGQQPCPTPADNLDCMPSDHYWHTIGTVRVDPADGTLWVGSGDAHVTALDATSFRPYDVTNTAGKILHVDKFGRGLPGHPFCPEVTDLTRTCTKVYATGFRNPFRFALREGQGPVVGDVGLHDYEEIDLVRPGRNYGWPCYEGTSRNKYVSSHATCQALYAKEGTAEAATPPSWSYPHSNDGGAVIAGPVYRGTGYPADMRGDIFVGDYVNGWVKRLEVDADDRITAVHDFATGWTGVTLFEAPDRNIGYLDYGKVSAEPGVSTYRFAGATNAAPTAVATATPTSGNPPLTVTFSSVGSSDPEGGTLTYEWDFGDGSPHVTAADPQYTYTADGTYTVRLTVRDPQGAPGTATTVITVGDNAAPVASIDAPADGFTYSGGVPVELRGSATDAEDGTLSGDSLSWEVLLRHNTHFHPVTSPTGATASFTPLTDHDADSGYEIRLTATDSTGATHTAVRTIQPRTVQLTLASSPAGVPLSYEGDAAPAPSTRTSAVGFKASVEAPLTHVVDGVTYRFQSWSDGGAAAHVVDVPGTATTLTANYVADGAAGTQVVEVRVAAGSDDAEQRVGGSTGLTSSDLELVVDGSAQQVVGVRFAGVAIPAGATVTRAWVQFQTDEVDSGASSLTIRVEANANPATYVAGTGTITARPVTGGVAWSPPAWPTANVAGADQRTPDLAGLVQAAIDRSGWVSGNAIALQFSGSGERTAEAFEGSSSGAPLLHVEYTTDGAPGPGNGAPVVSAGADQSVAVPGPVSLGGTVTDDGLPAPPGAVTSSWSMLSGPGTVTFEDAAAPATTATFSAEGTYVLQLSASDSVASGSDTATVTVTPATGGGGGGGTQVVEVRVAAGSDDAEQRVGGSTGLTSSDLELVVDGSAQQVVGVRFAGVAIPAGATVTRAWVQFEVDEVSTGGAALTIAVEANANPATYVSGSGTITARPVTGGVTWSPPDWPTRGVAGPAQRTPDLAGLVQAAIDRSGWVSGNAIALQFSGSGERTAEAFEGSSSGAPLLHVEYTTGG